MSTAIMKLDDIQVPAHLLSRQATNTAFLAGLSTGGGFPTISMSGKQFQAKIDGKATIIPVTLKDGNGKEVTMPASSISVVLLGAKENLDKTYYAEAYDPNASEAKAPDCFSRDGVRPDASSTLKQAESCAGCPMNVFGSGTDNSGNPSKGKACADSKQIAVLTNGAVFGIKIVPASLKNFAFYVKETTRRGVDLTTGWTIVSFDDNFKYPVYKFDFGGFLPDAVIAKIDALKSSQEVLDIIGGGAATAPVPAALAAPKAAPPADPFATTPVVETAKPKAVRVPKEKPVEVAVVEDDDLSALAAELGIDLG